MNIDIILKEIIIKRTVEYSKMEILFDETSLCGVKWYGDKDNFIDDLKSLHSKYYIKRKWKSSKYQLINTFLNKYNIPISEEQENIFEQVHKNSEINPIEDAEEILLLSTIADEIESTNLPPEQFNKLYENKLNTKLAKELDEFLKEDKCISCYNVYKFEEQKLMRCGNCRCKIFGYCSKKCQKEDWKTHKILCCSVRQAMKKLKAEIKQKQEEAEGEGEDESKNE